jgi:hypothetical protein
MIADFAARLAVGLSASLLLITWREVPLRYFRTHTYIILGLWVVAALDSARGGIAHAAPLGAIVAAVLAYLASLSWGLGLTKPADWIDRALTIAGVIVLIVSPKFHAPAAFIATTSGSVASALVLGTIFSAMLLGHHYLTAPAMSMNPLRRFTRAGLIALIVRAGLAAWGLSIWLAGTGDSANSSLVDQGSIDSIILAARWLVGFGAVAVALVLALRTIAIRSTQSATGILYIALILVLFGEVTALILSRSSNLVL